MIGDSIDCRRSVYEDGRHKLGRDEKNNTGYHFSDFDFRKKQY